MAGPVPPVRVLHVISSLDTAGAEIALYRLLRGIDGARFENRQVVFFAIILPLALAAFWLARLLSGSPL